MEPFFSFPFNRTLGAKGPVRKFRLGSISFFYLYRDAVSLLNVGVSYTAVHGDIAYGGRETCAMRRRPKCVVVRIVLTLSVRYSAIVRSW